MNKRRQIADSNPKNLTHFSGNSMSSSGTVIAGGSAVAGIGTGSSVGINRSPINATKSIIIGAGQPIIVPGEARANSNVNSTATKSNANPNTTTILSKVNSDAIASVRSSLQSEHFQSASMTTMNDNIKWTVEEFCPDGGALDKGFLDDLPVISANADARTLDDNGDSDSDSNDNGNPLVAKFHDDPFDDLSVAKGHNPVAATPVNAQMALKAEPKINPLSKNKNKSPTVPDLSVILTSERRSSNSSSEDIEIPHILKTKANSFGHGSDGQSNEDFDWLSDSNQRHSPDGGEDETSLPSIDKTVRNSSLATISAISIETNTKLDRLQLNDGVSGSGSSADGIIDEAEAETEATEAKEKGSKSKKKKKEKKEKKEKKHSSGEKEKKRTKSKKSTFEDLLSENKERPSHSDRYEAEDDQYEAL